MSTISRACSKTIISMLLLTMMALASTAAQLPGGGCAGELIAFSPCLPYVSSPPNNVTSSPSLQCCVVFSSTFEGADGACLCYLIREPLILGFPLNASKLLALSSLCAPGNATSARNSSLESFCLAPAESPTQLPSPPAEPPVHVPTLPLLPARSSEQPEKMSTIGIWFQRGIIVVIVLILAYL